MASRRKGLPGILRKALSCSPVNILGTKMSKLSRRVHDTTKEKGIELFKVMRDYIASSITVEDVG